MDSNRNFHDLRFPASRLDALRDRLTVRDPRGRCAHASIGLDAEGRFCAQGRFIIVHEYRIRKPDAIRFLDVTRDENPIHVEEDIVPGAMTLSKNLFPVEVLLDGFETTRVKAKFTGASFYDQRTVNHFFIDPGCGGGEVDVQVNTYQAGRIIAKTEVQGRIGVPAPLPGSARAPAENMALLRSFCESLSIDPGVYMEGGRLLRSAFPRAFLASLPSGEMVRQFKGKGGMLNVLSLDFDAPPYPIDSDRLPEVELEKGRTGPKMFNRVLTRIMDGIRTYGQGFALVYKPVTTG